MNGSCVVGNHLVPRFCRGSYVFEARRFNVICRMALSTVRCVVFDLDDTLWCTSSTLDRAHEAMVEALVARHPSVAAQYGSREAFKAQMQHTMDKNPQRNHDFTFLRKETLQRLTQDDVIAKDVYDLWFEQRNRPCFFPGALEALSALRHEGLLLGSLTDGNSDPSTISGLAELLDFSISAREAGASKPDQRMFSLCEERSGCRSDEIVMVGDNVAKDVLGAQRAGWRAIWVKPPGGQSTVHTLDCPQQKAEVEASPLATISHVREVLGVLRASAHL